MARRRKRRRNKKRLFIAYFLRTICVLVLVAIIVGAVFLVKGLVGNIQSKSSSNDITENSIEVTKKGTIIGNIFESFSEDYYSEKELSKMIDEEVADYCKLSGDDNAVKVSDCVVEDGNAKLSVEYKSSADYRSFNSTEFYCDTVENLLSDGFNFNQNLIDVSDSKKFISTTDIKTIAGNHAIVTDEEVVIICPSKILYYTSNVELIDKSIGKAKPGDGVAIVIYK